MDRDAHASNPYKCGTWKGIWGHTHPQWQSISRQDMSQPPDRDRPDAGTISKRCLLTRVQRSFCAASTAQYVRMFCAPARLIPVSDSKIAWSRSIQPFSAAASIIEYSPEIW